MENITLILTGLALPVIAGSLHWYHKSKATNDKLIATSAHENELNALKSEYEKKELTYQNTISLLETEMKMLSQNDDLLLSRFKDLSEDLMEKSLTKTNAGFDNVLKPLSKQLEDFKGQINTVYTEEAKDRSKVEAELSRLNSISRDLNDQTLDLKRALTGDNKAVGKWGEIVLETVLSNSGLREGFEFSKEVVLNNKDKTIYRPDVVVHLPDERDIIIDAKTSLNYYEEYVRTGNKTALKEHVKSIKAHIKSLGEKNYSGLDGVNSLSFIFMFVPIESSLSVALAEDTELFEKAYKQNIFLVSPSTLMMSLKVVENTWKHKSQEENVKKIMDKAGAIYDKFAGFVGDMEKIGAQLSTVEKTYSGAMNKLSDGNGNLVKQTKELKELGANTSKNLN